MPYYNVESRKVVKLKKRIKKSYKRYWIYIFLTFVFLVYLTTSAGNTPYNYFTRLANAFLEGRFYLNEAPPWLNELIRIGESKFAVAYSPAPAIVSIPFVFVFGKDFPQQYVAHIIGMFLGFTIYMTAKKITGNSLSSFWIFLLASFGNVVWYMSSAGSSWYLGQLCAALFLSLAIFESFNKKRVLLIGIYLGASYLSRVHTILVFPFFVFMNKKNYLKRGVGIIAGIIPFIIFNGFYNFARFGVVWDKGYTLIPGVLNEPWYQKGIFNLSYIPKHLKIIFLKMPIFSKNAPFIKPSWEGLSIFITTPAFCYSLLAPIGKKIIKLSWVAIISIAIVIFSHGSTGFTQFGYRFAVDFYPFLFLILIFSLKKTGVTWHHWALLVFSIAVNLWGVIFINKFGWVSF